MLTVYRWFKLTTINTNFVHFCRLQSSVILMGRREATEEIIAPAGFFQHSNHLLKIGQPHHSVTCRILAHFAEDSPRAKGLPFF